MPNSSKDRRDFEPLKLLSESERCQKIDGVHHINLSGVDYIYYTNEGVVACMINIDNRFDWGWNDWGSSRYLYCLERCLHSYSKEELISGISERLSDEDITSMGVDMGIRSNKMNDRYQQYLKYIETQKCDVSSIHLPDVNSDEGVEVRWIPFTKSILFGGWYNKDRYIGSSEITLKDMLRKLNISKDDVLSIFDDELDI